MGREAFWESGSLCHGFSTSPVVFFQEVILGIRAVKPGYTEFSLNPRPLDLTYASGSVYTPHGMIFVKWERVVQGKLDVHIEVPGGCIAILPDNSKLVDGLHNIMLS